MDVAAEESPGVLGPGEPAMEQEDFQLYDDLFGLGDGAKEGLAPNSAPGSSPETQERIIAQLRGEIQRLQDKLCEAASSSIRARRREQRLRRRFRRVQKNMSLLLKTCRNEINRKNEAILDLRRQLENLIFRRGGAGAKSSVNVGETLKSVRASLLSAFSSEIELLQVPGGVLTEAEYLASRSKGPGGEAAPPAKGSSEGRVCSSSAKNDPETTSERPSSSATDIAKRTKADRQESDDTLPQRDGQGPGTRTTNRRDGDPEAKDGSSSGSRQDSFHHVPLPHRCDEDASWSRTRNDDKRRVRDGTRAGLDGGGPSRDKRDRDGTRSEPNDGKNEKTTTAHKTGKSTESDEKRGLDPRAGVRASKGDGSSQGSSHKGRSGQSSDDRRGSSRHPTSPELAHVRYSKSHLGRSVADPEKHRRAERELKNIKLRQEATAARDKSTTSDKSAKSKDNAADSSSTASHPANAAMGASLEPVLLVNDMGHRGSLSQDGRDSISCSPRRTTGEKSDDRFCKDPDGDRSSKIKRDQTDGTQTYDNSSSKKRRTALNNEGKSRFDHSTRSSSPERILATPPSRLPLHKGPSSSQRDSISDKNESFQNKREASIKANTPSHELNERGERSSEEKASLKLGRSPDKRGRRTQGHDQKLRQEPKLDSKRWSSNSRLKDDEKSCSTSTIDHTSSSRPNKSICSDLVSVSSDDAISLSSISDKIHRDQSSSKVDRRSRDLAQVSKSSSSTVSRRKESTREDPVSMGRDGELRLSSKSNEVHQDKSSFKVDHRSRDNKGSSSYVSRHKESTRDDPVSMGRDGEMRLSSKSNEAHRDKSSSKSSDPTQVSKGSSNYVSRRKESTREDPVSVGRDGDKIQRDKSSSKVDHQMKDPTQGKKFSSSSSSIVPRPNESMRCDPASVGRNSGNMQSFKSDKMQRDKSSSKVDHLSKVLTQDSKGVDGKSSVGAKEAINVEKAKRGEEPMSELSSGEIVSTDDEGASRGGSEPPLVVSVAASSLKRPRPSGDGDPSVNKKRQCRVGRHRRTSSHNSSPSGFAEAPVASSSSPEAPAATTQSVPKKDQSKEAKLNSEDNRTDVEPEIGYLNQLQVTKYHGGEEESSALSDQEAKVKGPSMIQEKPLAGKLGVVAESEVPSPVTVGVASKTGPVFDDPPSQSEATAPQQQVHLRDSGPSEHDGAVKGQIESQGSRSSKARSIGNDRWPESSSTAVHNGAPTQPDARNSEVEFGCLYSGQLDPRTLTKTGGKTAYLERIGATLAQKWNPGNAVGSDQDDDISPSKSGGWRLRPWRKALFLPEGSPGHPATSPASKSPSNAGPGPGRRAEVPEGAKVPDSLDYTKKILECTGVTLTRVDCQEGQPSCDKPNVAPPPMFCRKRSISYPEPVAISKDSDATITITKVCRSEREVESSAKPGDSLKEMSAAEQGVAGVDDGLGAAAVVGPEASVATAEGSAAVIDGSAAAASPRDEAQSCSPEAFLSGGDLVWRYQKSQLGFTPDLASYMPGCLGDVDTGNLDLLVNLKQQALDNLTEQAEWFKSKLTQRAKAKRSEQPPRGLTLVEAPPTEGPSGSLVEKDLSEGSTSVEAPPTEGPSRSVVEKDLSMSSSDSATIGSEVGCYSTSTGSGSNTSRKCKDNHSSATTFDVQDESAVDFTDRRPHHHRISPDRLPAEKRCQADCSPAARSSSSSSSSDNEPEGEKSSNFWVGPKGKIHYFADVQNSPRDVQPRLSSSLTLEEAADFTTSAGVAKVMEKNLLSGNAVVSPMTGTVRTPTVIGSKFSKSVQSGPTIFLYHSSLQEEKSLSGEKSKSVAKPANREGAPEARCTRQLFKDLGLDSSNSCNEDARQQLPNETVKRASPVVVGSSIQQGSGPSSGQQAIRKPEVGKSSKENSPHNRPTAAFNSRCRGKGGRPDKKILEKKLGLNLSSSSSSSSSSTSSGSSESSSDSESDSAEGRRAEPSAKPKLNFGRASFSVSCPADPKAPT